jgi:hypothetical protein
MISLSGSLRDIRRVYRDGIASDGTEYPALQSAQGLLSQSPGNFGRCLGTVFLAVLLFWPGTVRATLLWEGNATNGTGVFKLLNLEDENEVEQRNPSTNGSSVTAVNDPIYGTVWVFYKAVNDLRCEAHGANGITPAIGQTYFVGWRSKLVLPPTADLNAIFQWKAYGTPQLQDFPITIAPGGGNLNLNEYNPSDAGGQTVLWSTPLVTNVWNQHVLAISVSDQDYGGSIEYWFNGVQQNFPNGTNIFYCRTFDGTSVDPKWGAYGGDVDAVYDYVCDLKIGTTYADVVDTLYALSASPPLQYTGLNGTNISYTIDVVTNGGFTGKIELAVTGLPANTAYSLSQTSFSGAGVATLSVTTSNDTPPGNYILLLRGIDGSQTNYYTVQMNVAKTPGTYVWNGPGAGSNNWSAAANWSPAGPPGPIDSVEFFNPGAVSAVSNINDVVDAAFGGAIASLQYGNTNNNHTTSITTGQTLNVGSLTVGTETDNGSAQAVFATVTGTGGALAMNTGSDMVVRQGSASSGSQRATLEMSGLGTFTASLGRVLVGVAGPVVRATGTLYLARTNTIYAAGAYPQICVGDNHANGGGQNYLYLGQTNCIFATSITIGRQKANGTLAFNSRFTNATALFRNVDGVSAVNSWTIGDNSAQSTSSSTSAGTCDFSLGTVDALVNSLLVGVSQTSTGANSSGTLTFASGIVNVNTLEIGVQSAGGATSAGTGRVNVNGSNAVLIVNSMLTLGLTSGGAGTTNTSGALSINGGAVLANAITAGAGSGLNSIAVKNGALTVTNAIGSSTVGISGVSLTNATLQFFVTRGQINLTATNLLTGGAGNTLNIASLPALGSGPAQFQLIQYTGGIGGAGYNFTLGSLPLGETVYAGHLSNNVAANSVDLVVVQAPATGPQFVAATWAGTNLVLSGANGVAGWPYYVLASTNLALPLNQWLIVGTNAFDGLGNFAFTNNVTTSPASQYFRLKLL